MRSTIPVVSDREIAKLVTPADALSVIGAAFGDGTAAGPRAVAERDVAGGRKTLLAMPAMNASGLSVVKIVVVERGASNRLVSQLLVLADTGEVTMVLEAHTITALRTAAASVYAARAIGVTGGRLAVMGSGRQARAQVRAFVDALSIEKVMIWARREEAAHQMLRSLCDLEVPIEIAPSREKAVRGADLVTCATASSTPLVLDEWVRPGMHIDLVGGFRPDMREADDALMRRARIFADTDRALVEAGDLCGPLADGVIAVEEVTIMNQPPVQQKWGGDCDVTVFKSVGHAAEDLVLAELVLHRLGAVAETPSAEQAITAGVVQ